MLAVVLLATHSAFAQQSAINGGPNGTARILGAMVDPAGKPIARVEIVIKDSTERIVSRALTNEFGRYCLSDLRPGRYTITRNAGKAAVPGDTVVADLPTDGLKIDWRVAADSTLATAVGLGSAASHCPEFLAGASAGNLVALGVVGLLGPGISIPLVGGNGRGKIASPSN